MRNSQVMEVLSPRVIKALNVAACAHDGHYRKRTDIPYVSHVFGVMHVAAAQGLDDSIREDVLIACLLHDTLEDVPDRYGEAQLREDFGDQVYEYVAAVTKDDSIKDWQQRSEAYLAHLHDAPVGAVVVSACDKLHNLSSILADLECEGEGLWQRFNSGKDAQRWWYHSILNVVEVRLPNLPLIGEYKEKLARLDQLMGGGDA